MDNNNATEIKKCDSVMLSGKVNLKGACRVCKAKTTNMTNIFDDESNIISKIEFCTGLTLFQHDYLPSQICNDCLSDLSIAHRFKTTCTQTEEVLQKLLIQNLKNEIDDVDNECFVIVSDDDMKEEIFKVEKEEEVVVKEETKSITRMKQSVRKQSVRKKTVRKQSVRKQTVKKQSVRKEALTSHTPKKKPNPLYCESCDIKFQIRKEKDEHFRKMHPDELENYICEICGKVLLHRASLYSHTRSHLPPQFACPTCDYVTWQKHDLRKHVLRHTGNKLFQCEFCTASYYTSSNLIHHIRCIHEKIKPYQCTLCDMRFYNNTKLSRHIDSHNDVKRFECEVCHSCFTRRCYWKKHLQRQHNILIPPQRPGKQKVNLVVGERLMNQPSNIFDKKS